MDFLRSVRTFAALALCWAGVFAGNVSAEDANPSLEYQVKASLLYNFLQFVEWPPSSFENEQTNLHVCHWGVDSFGAAFHSLEKEIVHGRRLVVSKLRETEQDKLASCHAIFFSHSDGGAEHSIVTSLRGQPILTVGEDERFLEFGGVINFVRQDNRVTFEINRATALANRLQISSKLLRLAHAIRDNR